MTARLKLLALALAMLALAPITAPAEEPSPVAITVATLRLAGGDYLAGELCDCDRAGVLRWRGPGFAAPLDFDLQAVTAADFPMSAERPKPQGAYRFELQEGDVLFGSLAGLSEEQAELETPRFGRLHVERASLRGMSRWGDGETLLSTGPSGLWDWSESRPEGAWRQESGRLGTSVDGASLARDFGLPAQVCIEFELAWSATPDFVLGLGATWVDCKTAFRLEVWDRDLVFVREVDDEADLAPLGEIPAGEGRCHFVMYLDQQKNRAYVCSPEGALVATLTVPAALPDESADRRAAVRRQSAEPPQRWIRLVNQRGDVRLEQLRIMRWDGEPPAGVQTQQPRVHRADGSVVYGHVQSLDAATGEWIVAQGTRTTRIPDGDVQSAVWSPVDDKRPRKLAAVLQDGTRISGELSKVEGGRLWLAVPGIAEPLQLPSAELQTFVVLDSREPATDTAGQAGRLEMAGARLHGWLQEGSGASCLVWRPRCALTASAVQAGAAGRIVYRDPPPPPVQQPQYSDAHVVVAAPAGIFGQVARVFVGDTAVPLPTYQPRRSDPALYLRTGESIPCRVERIDERGVTFRSPVFDATFVPHDKIRAVELENGSFATKIDPISRDRLLTLPRMGKDNPPTHLIRSTEGDYLRARLLSMDDKELVAEVRLETRRLPRAVVSRIIWLDAASPGTTGAPAEPAAPAGTRVQALRADGIRLTFFADEVKGTTIQGRSEVLGPCRVELAEVDQLILGAAIEQAALDLPYQRWKLQPAPDPRYLRAEGAAGGEAGTESALVGNPAPDFDLETLDGRRFRLSEHRGKVVVLDFWATWCGPCVQTLPQVAGVVREFADQQVLLVAVNLQEAPDAVTAMFDRLELKATVALDADGAVAEQYAAVAIPQTVIVGRDGKVARLFVGGGPQYAAQLRDALRSVLSPP